MVYSLVIEKWENFAKGYSEKWLLKKKKSLLWAAITIENIIISEKWKF